MKIVAIGDIHGHFNEFNHLMLQLDSEIDFNNDLVVFLGDYVDGGPDTNKVLDRLVEYKRRYPHWKFLFGNHESLLLDAISPHHPIYGDYYLWHNQGGKETLDSYKPENVSEYEKAIMQPLDIIPEEHINFLRSLDLFYETDDYFFVHAGIYPNRSIEKHKEAVSDVYPSGFNPALMTEGDMAYDMIWIREPFIGSEYDWEKKIIFGHTTWPYDIYRGQDENGNAVFGPGYPFVMENKIGIDTFMHNSGRLTAVILPEEKFVSSNWS